MYNTCLVVNTNNKCKFVIMDNLRKTAREVPIAFLKRRLNIR